MAGERQRAESPPDATATKVLLAPVAPNATASHGLFSDAGPAVQLTPLSVEAITRLVPLFATATKVPSPYATPCQMFCSGAARVVQLAPLSAEVITRLEPPVATATKVPSPYATAFHANCGAAELPLQCTTGPDPSIRHIR